jgi:transcriptional regulator with XRE-family HTH domain
VFDKIWVLSVDSEVGLEAVFMNSKQLGVFLRKKREAMGITQKELSQKLGLTVCQLISNIERGVSEVPTNRISVYAQSLELDPKELTKMIEQVLKKKTDKKTSTKLYGTETNYDEDPFIVKFISAWQEADEKDKENVKVLVSRFLNIKEEGKF